MAESDLNKILSKSPSVFVVCKKDGPDETLVKICGDLKKSFKKICVVTVNKPYSFLIKEFARKKINSSSFYFVDCISATNMEQVPSKQCTYISSPKALTELAIALNNLSKDVDLVVIDSFSGLAFHNELFFTYRFVNSIISKFRKKSIKSICLVVGETKKEILADISLFADKIIAI